jgi:hypothetical protein
MRGRVAVAVQAQLLVRESKARRPSIERAVHGGESLGEALIVPRQLQHVHPLIGIPAGRRNGTALLCSQLQVVVVNVVINAALRARHPVFPDLHREGPRGYFSAVLIDVNTVFIDVPTLFTAVMIARAIPAAIKPYSIAVVPD